MALVFREGLKECYICAKVQALKICKACVARYELSQDSPEPKAKGVPVGAALVASQPATLPLPPSPAAHEKPREYRGSISEQGDGSVRLLLDGNALRSHRHAWWRPNDPRTFEAEFIRQDIDRLNPILLGSRWELATVGFRETEATLLALLPTNDDVVLIWSR